MRNLLAGERRARLVDLALISQRLATGGHTKLEPLRQPLAPQPEATAGNADARILAPAHRAAAQDTGHEHGLQAG